MNNKKISLVLIEDELMVSGMLQIWLARYRDMELVGCAADGEAGLKLCQSVKPDLALLDIRLPKLDGFELARRLSAEFPAMRLMFMSGLLDACTIWHVMQSNVHGYVNKSQPPELLITAIRAVAGGSTFFGPTFSQVKREWLSQPEAFQKILSDREQQVLGLVASGSEDESIATELSISAATVEVHRKRIREKLGVHNDRGLLAYAHRWGLDIQTVPHH
jgi:DNA-binding NarL/FixJ family response regulator